MTMQIDMDDVARTPTGGRIVIGVLVTVIVIAIIALAVWWLWPGPAIAVEGGPAFGRLGAELKVTGERFPANKEIYVGLAAPGVPPTAGTTFVTVASGADGKFTVRFLYPSDPNWTRLNEVTIYAGTPEGDAVATSRLLLSSIAAYLPPAATLAPPTVTPLPAPSATTSPTPPFVAQISLQPASGRVGTLVEVRGRGWRPGDQVSFSLSGYTGNVGVASADQQGVLFGSFLFPKDYVGSAVTTVQARNKDGSLQASAVFQVIGLATPTVPSPTPLVITAWKGEYFNNPSLQGNPILTRNDANVDFNWGSSSPGPGVPNQHFSVRWTRTLYFSSGNYRIFTAVDDGVRMWFDDQMILDEWHAASGQQYMSDVFNVGEGMHTFKIEYYQDIGPASAKVWWQLIMSPTTTRTPTPTVTPSRTSTPTATATLTATTTLTGTAQSSSKPKP